MNFYVYSYTYRAKIIKRKIAPIITSRKLSILLTLSWRLRRSFGRGIWYQPWQEPPPPHEITMLPLPSLYQAQGLESMRSFTFFFLWCPCGSVVATRITPTGMWHLLTSSMPSVCPASWWWSTFKASCTQVATAPEPALGGLCLQVLSEWLMQRPLSRE